MPEPVIRFEELEGDALGVLLLKAYSNTQDCDALVSALGIWRQNYPQHSVLLLDCRQTTFLHARVIPPLRELGAALQGRGGELKLIVSPGEKGGIADMLFIAKTAPTFLTLVTMN
jgi:hypothetical protein